MQAALPAGSSMQAVPLPAGIAPTGFAVDKLLALLPVFADRLASALSTPLPGSLAAVTPQGTTQVEPDAAAAGAPPLPGAAHLPIGALAPARQALPATQALPPVQPGTAVAPIQTPLEIAEMPTGAAMLPVLPEAPTSDGAEHPRTTQAKRDDTDPRTDPELAPSQPSLQPVAAITPQAAVLAIAQEPAAPENYSHLTAPEPAKDSRPTARQPAAEPDATEPSSAQPRAAAAHVPAHSAPEVVDAGLAPLVASVHDHAATREAPATMPTVPAIPSQPAAPVVPSEGELPSHLRPLAPDAGAPTVAAPDPTVASPRADANPALVSVAHAADGSRRLVFRLDPPELGRMQIHIDRQEDAPARVIITVERQETLTLLLRDQQQLQRALDQAGVAPEGRTVTFNVAAATPEPRPDAATHSGSSLAGQPMGDGSSGAFRHADGTQRPPQAGSGPEADDEFAPPARTDWVRVGLDITA